MEMPTVVNPEQWQAAWDDLLVKEKQHLRAGDALAAERRRMPMVRIAGEYALSGSDGTASLADLFEGRSQLLVYHFMFEPGETDVCAGCSLFADNVAELAHLHARDTTLALVSRAPIDELERFRARMGWQIPWYSSHGTSFNDDLILSEGSAFGLTALLRDEEGSIFRTYYVSGRGVETLGTLWSFLDRTAYGRRERWEDSPDGWPQTDPYAWWRLHDEYVAT